MDTAWPLDERPARPTGRWWLTVATGSCLAFVVMPWLSSFGPHLPNRTPGMLAVLVVTATVSALFYTASRGASVARGLRHALWLLAGSSLLITLGHVLRLLHASGVAMPEIPGIATISSAAIWALGFAALLRLPLAPPVRGARWREAADIVIAVGGITLVIVMISTLPGIRLAPWPARLEILTYNVMAVANLVVLNRILVRGPERAIRLAVWCLAATIVIETLYLVVLQYVVGHESQDFRLADSLFFLDQIGYLYAGVFFLTGTRPEAPVEDELPDALRALNPLPLVAVVGVGVLLILAAQRAHDPAVLPLAIGLVVMTVLLVARLLGAAWENLELLRKEAAADRRRHADKMDAIGSLAGGVSHVINNLMTVILGHTEMGIEMAADRPKLRDHLERIDDAGRRAVTLAARLLAASGRQFAARTPARLSNLIRQKETTASAITGERLDIMWVVEPSTGDVFVDASEILLLLHELISNAGEAMPDGGQITVRVNETRLTRPMTSMYLTPPPGAYAVMEVSDTGRGIAPQDLIHVVDPFAPGRSVLEGRGLGLSVVHGIVTRCHGGMSIEARPGSGTRVCIYLPLSISGG
jgi:signal transduction histidine kinase